MRLALTVVSGVLCALQVGDDGVLLVDTSVAAMDDKIKDAIAKVSDKPIKLIINTHAHADHFGDMLVALRTRVQRLIDEGKSEDEAVAAKPTKDFDAQWVHQGNFLTGDAMTRLAYQSLNSARPPATR
jgi:glyoxylase-like metal-dependent hydrolase (beta-lactamase superfamily II)